MKKKKKTTRKKKPKGSEARQLDKKWSPRVIEAGYTALPTVLLKRQKALGLNAMDINVLLHILKHWWKPDENPFPAKSSIAACMGVDERTVQRHIAKMQKAGLIERVDRWHEKYGRQSNFYDLSGLVEKLKPLAQEELDEKERLGNEKRARATRTSARPK